MCQRTNCRLCDAQVTGVQGDMYSFGHVYEALQAFGWHALSCFLRVSSFLSHRSSFLFGPFLRSVEMIRLAHAWQ